MKCLSIKKKCQLYNFSRLIGWFWKACSNYLTTISQHSVFMLYAIKHLLDSNSCPDTQSKALRPSVNHHIFDYSLHSYFIPIKTCKCSWCLFQKGKREDDDVIIKLVYLYVKVNVRIGLRHIRCLNQTTWVGIS